MYVQLLKNASQSSAHKTYVIEHENKMYLQSYDRIICVYDKSSKELKISTHWTQSKLTRQYLLTFLNQYGILPCKTEKELLDAKIDGLWEIVKELN